ncbi:LysR family transcriptional regulator [Burkholderia sp. GS2Y]|uniref:LysR family transcriptional regulator n=1 Tax=Burkholderia theae TaxID=3143496 RepID=A0ABU9WT85_9BURK
MNLRHIQFLRLVIEKGSFAAAAGAAGVTQTAITLAMQALEHELGFALFYKEGRRKLATDQALALARTGQQVDNAVKELRTARGAKSTQGGQSTLRVGMAPAAGLLYGATIFQAVHLGPNPPIVRIVAASATEMLEQLKQHSLDLVIAPTPRKFKTEGLSRHVMYVAQPVICARKGHPLAGAQSLEEIAGAGWVVTGPPGTPGNLVEEALRVRKLPLPRIEAMCQDFRMLLRLVAGTDLLCVIPHQILVCADEHTAIQPLQICEALPRYEVCLHFAEGGRVEGSPLALVIAALLASRS